ASFRRWAQLLPETSRHPGRGNELGFWTQLLSRPALSLVDDLPNHSRHLGSRAQPLTLTLPAAISGTLLTKVVAAFYGGINDVLLAGLALAIIEWCRYRGRQNNNAVLLDLEGHGREE